MVSSYPILPFPFLSPALLTSGLAMDLICRVTSCLSPSLTAHLIISLCHNGCNFGNRAAKWVSGPTPVIIVSQCNSAIRQSTAVASLYQRRTAALNMLRWTPECCKPGSDWKCFPPFWTHFKDDTLWMWNETSVHGGSASHLCTPYLFPQEWAKGKGYNSIPFFRRRFKCSN